MGVLFKQTNLKAMKMVKIMVMKTVKILEMGLMIATLDLQVWGV